MTTLFVHGFVQMWTKKTGMTKSKEACIEIVEGKVKYKMVIHFMTEDFIKGFQLTNNIKDVVFKAFGGKQNHLHITFKNDSFLFIDKLSYQDGEQMKTMLDLIHQNMLVPSSDAGGSGPQEDEASDESLETEEGNPAGLYMFSVPSTSALAQASYSLPPLSASAKASTSYNETELVRSSDGTIKRISYGLKMSDDLLRKSNLILRRVVTKEKRKTRSRRVLDVQSAGNLFLDWSYLMEKLSRESLISFLFAPKYDLWDLDELHEKDLSFEFVAQNEWQGLPNLGNTCYVNVVLQALFSIPSFGDDLLAPSVIWGQVPYTGLTLCVVQLLVLRYSNNVNIKEKLLYNIKRAIAGIAGIFTEDIQNDAHEFLVHCLDQIKENVQYVKYVWGTRWQFPEGCFSQQDVAKPSVIICPVTSNFEFELKCLIICNACSRVISKTELHRYFSINLCPTTKENPLSIQSSLDYSFAPEELEYVCEKCAHNGSTAVQKFISLPRVLIIHVKRYDFKVASPLKKDDQSIIVPRFLSLSLHCLESTIPPPPLANSPNRKPSQANPERIYTTGTSMSFSTSASFFKSRKGSELSKDEEPKKKSKGKQPCKGAGKAKQSKGAVPQAGGPVHQEDPSLFPVHKYKSKSTSTSSAGLEETQEGRGPETSMLSQFTFAGVEKGLPKAAGDYDWRSFTGKCSPELGPQILQEEPLSQEYIQEQSTQEYKVEPLSQEHTETLERTADASKQEHEVKSSSKPSTRKRSKKKDLPEKPSGSGVQPRTGKTKNILRKMQRKVKKALEAIGETPAQKSSAQAKSSTAQSEKDKTQVQENRLEDCGRHPYQLIGVVSHIGADADAGHFVSEVFSFEKRSWYIFSDMQVTTKADISVQSNGMCASSGYLYFYMHNDIFQELMRRGEEVPE